MNRIAVFICLNYILVCFFLAISSIYAQQSTLQVGHSNLVENLKFSPDQKVLASAGKEGTIKLWHTETGRLLKTLQGFQKKHLDLWVFSPDSKYLLVVRENVQKRERKEEYLGKKEGYEISVWELGSGKAIQTWLFKGEKPFLVAERYLVLNTHTSIDIYDFLSQKITNTFIPKGDKFLVNDNLYVSLGNGNQSLLIQDISKTQAINLSVNFTENTKSDTLQMNKVMFLNKNIVLVDYEWMRYYENDKNVSQSRFFQVVDIKNRQIIYEQRYDVFPLQNKNTSSYDKTIIGLKKDTLNVLGKTNLLDENHLLVDYYVKVYDYNVDEYISKNNFFQVINLKTQKIIRQEKYYSYSSDFEYNQAKILIDINVKQLYYLKRDLDKQNIKLIHLITGKEIRLEKIEGVEKGMGYNYDDRYCFFQDKYAMGYQRPKENTDNLTAFVWDIKSGKVLMEIPEIKRNDYGGPPNVILHDIDSNLLTFLQYDSAAVYDIQNKELQFKFKHKQYGLGPILSADGNIMIENHQIINIKRKLIKDIFLGHRLSENDKGSIIFSGDKQHKYFAGSYGNKIQLIDLQNFQSKTLENSFYGVKSIKFNAEQDRFAFTTENLLKVYDFSTGLEESVLLDSTYQNNYSLAWAGNEIWINKGNALKCWNLETKRVSQVIKSESITSCFTLTSDNRLLINGGLDGKIRVWNISNQKNIQTFASHLSFVNAITLSKDDRLFASGGEDSTVVIYDIKFGKELKKLPKQDGIINALAFHPQQTLLASAGIGNTIYIWDTNKGELWHSFKLQQGGVEKLIFTPDSKYLISAGRDNNIQIWSLEKKELLHTLAGHQGWISDLSISSDGQYLFSAGLDGQIRLWYIKQGKEVIGLYTLLDGNDFVKLTPEGRFDGTPVGMDKLIHFVAGNEVIELSQLKERFYTPDLWKTLLEAPEKLSSDESLNQIELYPEFDLEGKGNQLNIKLRPRNGGIGKVNVYINGREVNESKTASPDFNPQRKTQIQLNLKNYQSYFSEGKNTISVKAYHQEGWLASRFQHITYQKGKSLESRGTDTTSKAKPEGLREDEAVDFDANITESKAVGDFYALCIGTSDYVGEGIKDLTFPTSDAQSMAEALKIGAKKFFVDEDEPNKNKLFIRTLTTDDKNPLNQPSKDNIRKAFQEIASKAKAEDMFVVFFAGHGTTFKKEDERFELFYYLTKDAGSRSVTQDALRKSHTISSDELIAWLKEIKAGKQVMILDACHSGQAVDNIFAQRDIPPSQKRALELMKDRTGLYIISGSAADAVSYESSEYGQGFLTYSLLMGMTGAALDKETSHLNVGTWFKYASNEVNRMAAEYNSTQQPQVAEPKNNFWIGKFEEKDRNLIPLKEAKPMFGEPTFQNQSQMRDNLRLSDLVKSELFEQTLQGRSANYIYTDSDNKKVNLIGGLYTIDNQGNIKVSFSIYKGDTLVAEIKDLEGNTKEIKDLAEQIVSEAKKRVVK